MRFLEDRLDRFCRKHPGFGLPNLMLYLIVGSAVVFLLDSFNSGGGLSALFSFVPYHIIRGQIWRLFTFVLVPMDANPVFFMLTLYMFWWMGRDLEGEWGTARFTLYYLVGMGMTVLGGFLLAAFLGGFSAPYVTATASYLHLSFFFALATLFPDRVILLFFFLPVKFKWLGWLDGALFLYGILTSALRLPQGLINLAGVVVPLLAVFNYLLFFWSDICLFCRRIFRRFKHQSSPKTIRFKEATAQARSQKGYVHKCAVCGKTDTDYPQEEFRYCSKCNGYYCYCSEHIGNHEHIQ